MSDNAKFKVGYGNVGDIETAIENGVIDGNDFVVTKDTSELYYVTSDKQIKAIQSKIPSYASTDVALLVINTLASTYAGQLITISNAYNKQVLYMVQQDGEKWTLDRVVPEQSGETTGLIWNQI